MLHYLFSNKIILATAQKSSLSKDFPLKFLSVIVTHDNQNTMILIITNMITGSIGIKTCRMNLRKENILLLLYFSELNATYDKL